MVFEKEQLYHIYNQGNNRNQIFFNRGNYQLFLKKIEVFISPYSDILAWCLMPNHFHLMILIKQTELPITKDSSLKNGSNSEDSLDESLSKKRTLNNSIGILLRSYTRIINAQNGFTGSLFRQETKASSIDSFKGLQPNSWKSKISIFNMLPENQYPQICFNYIHQNPVKSGLVKKDTDWEFSSARAYANLGSKSIANRKIARDYIYF